MGMIMGKNHIDPTKHNPGASSSPNFMPGSVRLLSRSQPGQKNYRSKIKNPGFCGQVYEVRSAVQAHIGEEIGLVNLTGLGARGSDADGDFVLYQVRQIIPRAVPGAGFDAEIPVLTGPHHPAIDEKDGDGITLGMSKFGKLKAPGGRSIVIAAQGEQKICRHNHFLPCVNNSFPLIQILSLQRNAGNFQLFLPDQLADQEENALFGELEMGR
jgi:hypothetical protein